MNLKHHMDKAGILGVILSHLCCIGLGANVGFFTAIGMGFLVKSAAWAPILVISLIIHIVSIFISYLKHKNILPFIISIIGSMMFFAFLFVMRVHILVYAGLITLIGASAYNYLCIRKYKIRNL